MYAPISGLNLSGIKQTEKMNGKTWAPNFDELFFNGEN